MDMRFYLSERQTLQSMINAFYRLQTDAHANSNQQFFYHTFPISLPFFSSSSSFPTQGSKRQKDSQVMEEILIDRFLLTGCNICVHVSLYANTMNNSAEFFFFSLYI